MSRTFLLVAAVSGFLAVALGAFGAHGLRASLESAADGAKRLEWWNTAAHYHLIHSLAVALAGYLVERSPGSAATVSGWCFVAGIAVFSGSLYVMTVTGLRALGAVTPIGGVLLLVGWAAAAWSAYSSN
jgi:uncharacterized membrane protein YgdD (TMEM256/DUF423 family)